MISRVSRAEQLFAGCSSSGKIDSSKLGSDFSSILQEVSDDEGVNKKKLGYDPTLKRNQPENIDKWVCHPDRYEEPDDAALVDFYYDESHYDYTNPNVIHAGGNFVVYQKFPDGTEFFYPPRDASMEDKLQYIRTMKTLTHDERFEMANLVRDKFGATPFHGFLNRIPMNQAGSVSAKDLFSELREEIRKHMADMLTDDPARKLREQEINMLDHALENIDKHD